MDVIHKTHRFLSGGGICVDRTSTLTLSHSSVLSNTALMGGGIAGDERLIISHSTIANNVATVGGGLASNNGNVTILHSTFSGNEARDGGGVAVYNFTELQIDHSTIVSNSASFVAGVYGGNRNTVNIGNTIFSNEGGNCSISDPAISGGHNLDSDGSCLLNAAGDVVNVDPLLAPLGNYGGGTMTHALLPGSPAINAGATSRGTTTDQRGEPLNGVRDIGAFERQGVDSFANENGNNQVANVNTPFANPLSVTIVNSAGEPTGPGVAVLFNAPVSGSSITTQTITATTDINGTVCGYCHCQWTSG